jgi:hypothetical protein
MLRTIKFERNACVVVGAMQSMQVGGAKITNIFFCGSIRKPLSAVLDDLGVQVVIDNLSRSHRDTWDKVEGRCWTETDSWHGFLEIVHL